ncbi:murein biosynthesis integral membrane protein MurJ [Sandarakinorhabdus oryzae]|uniref:murein biosynthesis integral membrane protein MurJ n=1 Tax=Sandarakinorhabdus oryzae TaxID=2675220 RepID=UPI0012E2A038|nr:murein biosynthesis integral membrane protein MurJ [Sandarakinorhabdus oryzae]
MSLVRATATIGSLTLLSRVAGFIRDVLQATLMGAGMAADAFLIAQRLPNLFRALFAEGAFASAFVPMFNRQVGADGGRLDGARRFAEDVLAVLLPLLLAFTVVMVVAAAPVVWALTGGFPDAAPDKFALTVALTRLTFPYLMLISLTSLLGGLLNSVGRFAVNAAAPILLNLVLIAGLLWSGGSDDVAAARVQALCVTLGGIAQLLWLMWSCSKAGISLRLRLPRLTPQVRALFRLILPAALGAGAVQVNLLISTALAARFLGDGAVSWLYYADRLNQLPLGIIGIGVGTALLPTMSRLIGADDVPGAIAQQNRAMELVLILTLPAAAGLVVAAQPIIALLFQHGQFTAADTDATAAALAGFALGLPAYVLIKILTPGFHARSDTSTPVRVALAAMLVNLVANLALVWPLGHVGIALGTAISAWVNAGALWWLLVQRGQFALDARARRLLPRLLLATLAMVAVLVAGMPLVAPLAHNGLATRAIAVALLIGGAGLAYLGAARLLGLFTLKGLVAQVKRKS